MGNSITPLRPTETRPGFAEVATQAEVALGTDDERLVSAAKLSQNYIGYYSLTRPYAAGRVVVHNGILYRSLVPTTGNAPPHSDWTTAGGSIVLPANTSVVPVPSSGSGTQASPFVLSALAITSGMTSVLVASVTVTGLTPGEYIEISDLNYGTNGSRFWFTSNVVGGDGTLRFEVRYNDLPTSAGGASYTLNLKIGSSSSAYVQRVVSILSVSVPPANVSMVPAFASGTGTLADPFIIAPATSIPGATNVVVGSYTIVGLPANALIPLSDSSSVTNEDRFTFTNRTSNALGVLTGKIMFNDVLPSLSGTSYTLNMVCGNVAPQTYIRHVRTLQDGNPFFPDDIIPISANSAALVGKTYVLTATLDLTLPAAPGDGEWVDIVERSQVLTCRILGNGKLIGNQLNVGVDELNLDRHLPGFRVVYDLGTDMWYVKL